MNFLFSRLSGNRKALLTSCLVCLFVVAQFSASAHASEHMFHHADSSCIVLSSAENNAFNGEMTVHIRPADRLLCINDSLNDGHNTPSLYPKYSSRAPPFPAS